MKKLRAYTCIVFQDFDQPIGVFLGGQIYYRV